MSALLPAHATTDLTAATQALDELYEAGDYEAIAWNLVNLTNIRKGLSDLCRAVEDALVEIAPWTGGQLEVDGLPLMERMGGADRKQWRWDEVRPIIRRHLLDPQGTGEKPDEARAAAVDETLDEMFTLAPLTGSNGPRVKALRALGVNPDEYCSTTPGRTSVQIHGGD